MSKAYVIGLIKFTNKRDFIENFASRIPKLIKEGGGLILSRTPDSHFHEGRDFDLHVVVEFDDFSKAKSTMASEEWETITSHRTNNSDTEYGSFLLLEGGDKLAK